MKFRRRAEADVSSQQSPDSAPGAVDGPLLSVVLPVYNVAAYLPETLESLLGSAYANLEVVAVDDGSTDDSGAILDRWAERDPRVQVSHTENGGLGAARNVGVGLASGEYLAFADSDDVVPLDAYPRMVAALEASGSDFVTGSVYRWERTGLIEPPWMRRLHNPARSGIRVEDHPEILGDVFAWNKLFRRSWWRSASLAWPEQVRYEDQPTTTRAFLTGTFDVLPEHVYHWRIRDDGSSITQQRSSLEDLRDRWTTKQMALDSVLEHGDDTVTEVFTDRVLPGDLHRYFVEIPGCDDDWWDLLSGGVRLLWGERSLTHSGLPPVHRLTGWLVEQGRRDDAEGVMRWAAERQAPAPRVRTDQGLRIEVPVIDQATVDPQALLLHPGEN